jgi:hypothetical protein
MAVNYDTSPNGLFIQIGKIAKHYNLQAADAANLDADLADIMGAFEAMTAGANELMVEGVPTTFAGWESQYVARRASLVTLANTRIQDKETILDELNLAVDDVAAVLSELIRQMNSDSESVNASAVTIGSVSANASNSGNGTILTTKLLDGVTSPGSNARGTFAANPQYRGVDSELAVESETMTIEVATDSFQDGATEGGETFNWNGKKAGVVNGFGAEGSGAIGTITGAHSTSGNLLTNGDFEEITSNAPDDWTIDNGTAGTHILQETAGANVYHGDSSIRFVGDGSQAAIGISQAFGASDVTANKLYCVTVRIKADASISAGDLTIQFSGTGYTAGSSEKISIAAASLPTSWSLQSFFVLMPAEIPADFKLAIDWSGTPTDTKNLYIDDLSFSAVNYGGGVGVVAVRGSDPFIKGDRFTFSVANDEAGVFQKFFRQAFGVQLPSDDSGSETIDDSLAT